MPSYFNMYIFSITFDIKASKVVTGVNSMGEEVWCQHDMYSNKFSYAIIILALLHFFDQTSACN